MNRVVGVIHQSDDVTLGTETLQVSAGRSCLTKPRASSVSL